MHERGMIADEKQTLNVTYLHIFYCSIFLKYIKIVSIIWEFNIDYNLSVVYIFRKT